MPSLDWPGSHPPFVKWNTEPYNDFGLVSSSAKIQSMCRDTSSPHIMPPIHAQMVGKSVISWSSCQGGWSCTDYFSLGPEWLSCGKVSKGTKAVDGWPLIWAVLQVRAKFSTALLWGNICMKNDMAAWSTWIHGSLDSKRQICVNRSAERRKEGPRAAQWWAGHGECLFGICQGTRPKISGLTIRSKDRGENKLRLRPHGRHRANKQGEHLESRRNWLRMGALNGQTNGLKSKLVRACNTQKRPLQQTRGDPKRRLHQEEMLKTCFQAEHPRHERLLRITYTPHNSVVKPSPTRHFPHRGLSTRTSRSSPDLYFWWGITHDALYSICAFPIMPLPWLFGYRIPARKDPGHDFVVPSQGALKPSDFVGARVPHAGWTIRHLLIRGLFSAWFSPMRTPGSGCCRNSTASRASKNCDAATRWSRKWLTSIRTVSLSFCLLHICALSGLDEPEVCEEPARSAGQWRDFRIAVFFECLWIWRVSFADTVWKAVQFSPPGLARLARAEVTIIHLCAFSKFFWGFLFQQHDLCCLWPLKTQNNNLKWLIRWLKEDETQLYTSWHMLRLPLKNTDERDLTAHSWILIRLVNSHSSHCKSSCNISKVKRHIIKEVLGL